MTKNGYQRLPGRGASLAAHHRLYLGADHLLMVDSYGFQESYRRFFLSDIQAITLRRTLRGPILNGLFALFALACLGVAALNPDLSIGMAIPGGAFLLLLLVNTLFGPTCRCDIQTQVQTVRIRSLHRIRTARKFLRRIQPLIEAAQADRSPTPAPAPAPAPSAAEPVTPETTPTVESQASEPPAS